MNKVIPLSGDKNQMRNSRRLLLGLVLVLGGMVIRMPALSETYKVEAGFNGCEHGKIYPLTRSGKYLRCDHYKYFYKYRPTVEANGTRVYEVGGREIRGTIVNGRSITTNIADEWEGCDYNNAYRLDNGMTLQCSTYFYEYAYRPSVEIIVIEGTVAQVLVNGELRDDIQVYQ
jgi:hypothetical protein